MSRRQRIVVVRRLDVGGIGVVLHRGAEVEGHLEKHRNMTWSETAW